MKKIYLLTFVLLSGCSAKQSGYALAEDIAPAQGTEPSMQHIEDAVPRYEDYSTQGNRDYSIKGQTYKVMQNPGEFSETGRASWYGKKFHGHKTSNGEIYDMYSMTAAHKTLPLPSYLEVENVANGRKVIVRVNDRGPFSEKRILDLSFAAATKLDMVDSGIADVKITLIKKPKPVNSAEWHTAQPNRYFIQLAAVKNQTQADDVAKDVKQKFDLPVNIEHSEKVYRVRLGPFYDYVQTQDVAMHVKSQQIQDAFIVVEPVTD